MKPGPALVASSISGLARRRSAIAAASFAGGCCGTGGDHGGVGCHVAVGGIARGRDLHAVRDVRRQIRHGGVERIEHLGTDGLEQVGHAGCDAGNGAAVQGRSGERTNAGAVLPGAKERDRDVALLGLRSLDEVSAEMFCGRLGRR